MSDAYQQVIDHLQSKKRVLITTHIRPDGDALGSTAAMHLALKHKGIDSQILLLSHLPRKYAFVYTDNGIEHIDVESGWPETLDSALGVRLSTLGSHPNSEHRTPNAASFDTLLVLDTGTWSQLPGLQERLANLPATKIVIDHHLTQEDWADVKLVDTSAGACGEIVEELLTRWQIPIDQRIAAALFVAIVTDTGWFQYSNTRPQTLRLAADLMEQGKVDTDRIHNLLYRNERAERVALHARGLQNLELLSEGRVAVIALRKQDFAETNSHVNDTEDLINIPLQIRTVEVAALLTEPPEPGGPIRVSMRSKGQTDVARFAEQFGGGGHARASGMKFATSIDEAHDKLVDALLKLEFRNPKFETNPKSE